LDSASSVAKRWKTRIGSSELSTVTADPSRIRSVLPAIAASTVSGDDTAKSSRWCSPMPMKFTPTVSASTASTTTLRITSASVSRRPTASRVTSPNVSSPNSTCRAMSFPSIERICCACKQSNTASRECIPDQIGWLSRASSRGFVRPADRT
jgi:hypothetical protein